MTMIPTVAVPRCPLCGTARAAVLHAGLTDRVFGVAPGTWTLVRCDGCGAARLDPRPSDEALADIYAGYYTHEPPPAPPIRRGLLRGALHALGNDHLNARLGYALTPAWRGGRIAGRLAPPMAALAERTVRSLPSGGRLLDVGCGNGAFVAHAAAAGWQASGIDIDETAVRAACAAGIDVTLDTIDAHAAGAPERYDAVTLSHVIEHVADPVTFLRCARTLLRPGGWLWVATPNLAGAGHARYGADWIGLDPPRHLVVFNPRSLAGALARAGFEDVRALRPAPHALTEHRRSAAISAGASRAIDAPAAGAVVRVRALWAAARAQLDDTSADELLVLARRP